ncbi:restriction endonuclease subunit S [Alteromonas sp. A081]|uniref:restriction endonuclease subunit S n=1 Tax=Alteromonas sp. A081 TaxID=3410269 RepID=UPI003B981378
MVKLGELFKVTSGGTPSRRKPEFYEGGTIPWIKTGDLHNKNVTEASEYITQDGLDGSSARMYPKGTVLVAMYGATIGACSILDIDACTNQACAAFTPNSEVDINFLYYLLKRNKSTFVKAGSGGAQPNISATFLKEFEIPLPPLDEQKRIAAILDKADAIRRKRQQAIDLADDFLRSVFLDMFGDPVANPKGWEVKSLASLCNKITDGTHHSPPIVESGVPYVTAKHLKKSGLEFHANPWFVSEDEHKKIYARCNPEPNDVLYIKDGATTGLAAINEYNFEFSMLSSLALLKPDFDLVTSEFLCMFLNHPRTKLVLTANMAGAAITRLTLAKIKDVKVPLPDLNTQQNFKEIYISVMEFLEKVKASEDLSDQEFNSLSQQAFAGEL